jgi:L(+)-tartrate dehydratase alpha subunit
MDKAAAGGKLTEVMAAFTGYVGKHLPTDVEEALARLRAAETAPLARTVYDSMSENQSAAARLDRPAARTPA